MSAAIRYNRKSPAVKRILQEAKELQLDPCTDYQAQPLEDNIFEWHFTVRGADGTEFEGGRYHGRILLPNEYPFQPPNIMLLTPNGRFELNKKICLSITGYHPEFWQPVWGIRTVLLGIIGFFPTKANGAIGGVDYTEAERRILAKQSRTWKCEKCENQNIDILPDIEKSEKSDSSGYTLKTADVPEFNFAYEGDKQKSTGREGGENLSEQSIEKIRETPRIEAPGGQSSSSTEVEVVPPTNTELSSKIPDSSSVSSPGTLEAIVSPTSSHAHNTQQRQQQQRSNVPPFWLDGLIIAFAILLLGLVLKKFI